MNTFPLFASRGAPHVAATLTTAFGTANSNLKYTAVTPGAAGNSITVQYQFPEQPQYGVPTTSTTVGNAITVVLLTNGGTQQKIAISVVGSVTVNGTAKITFSSTRFTTFSVFWNVTSAQTNATKAQNLLSALVNDTNFQTYFDYLQTSRSSNTITIFCNSAANDATLAAQITNGTSVGMTTTNATTTQAGVAAVITATASEVLDAVQADVDASLLVTVQNATGNDGTGVVSTLAATNLSGGS